MQQWSWQSSLKTARRARRCHDFKDQSNHGSKLSKGTTLLNTAADVTVRVIGDETRENGWELGMRQAVMVA
ncbi:DNA cytosine-5-methyltransferase 1 [Sesbania bispinosa]|nr:DNA cytosine-5-methyltransferase 1 [Sesbania bispinosa]